MYYQLYIRMLVLRRKAQELLTAIAKGEEIPEPGQHPVQEAPEEPEEAADAEEPEVSAENEDDEVEEEAVVEESTEEEETEEADEASE